MKGKSSQRSSLAHKLNKNSSEILSLVLEVRKSFLEVMFLGILKNMLRILMIQNGNLEKKP